MAVENLGTIICAHCTCMAGLGEACSHIAAKLFVLDANSHFKKSQSCTTFPCSWLPSSFKNISYATIADIDFSTPNFWSNRYKALIMPVIRGATFSHQKMILNACTRIKLSDCGKLVFLSIVPNFLEVYVPLSE